MKKYKKVKKHLKEDSKTWDRLAKKAFKESLADQKLLKEIKRGK